jgi:glycerol kinase
MQFQADILDRTVIRPKCLEATAQGAAYAAGLAPSVKFWSGLDEVKQNWGEDRRFEPSMDADSRAELDRGWSKAVERSLGWVE